MKYNFVKVQNILLPCNCLHYKHVTIYPKKGKPFMIYVPCGKCYRCRKRIASEWAYRNEIESETHFCYSALFTYADDKLPYYNGVPVVNRVHLSDAFKRFRYYMTEKFGISIRFFAVGEYAPETKRPHYHAIIYSDKDISILRYNNVPLLDYLNEKLSTNVWTHGLCHIQEFDTRANIGKMVGYMTTYMLTQLPQQYNNEHAKPFRYMSRFIGASFKELYPKVWQQNVDSGNWSRNVVTSDGRTITVGYPRYFVKKWATDFHKDMRSEKYYTSCLHFEDYLDYEIYKYKNELKQNPSRAYRQCYPRILGTLQRLEKETELENYRKRKVHKNNK